MLAVVGSLSAVKGVKYAGVFIVGIWWGGAAETRPCASTGKKGETRVHGSLEYFL